MRLQRIPVLIPCLLLALAILAPPRPAAAFSFEVDCKDTSLTGGFVEGVRRQKGIAGLIINKLRGKDTSDAYRLISTGNGAMMTVWSGLMCAATAGDPTAAALRTRWSETIGRSTDGFTIGRAYDYYMKRVKYAAPDATRLLSDGERRLIGETLAYMAPHGPQYARAQRLLTEKLGL